MSFAPEQTIDIVIYLSRIADATERIAARLKVDYRTQFKRVEEPKIGDSL